MTIKTPIDDSIAALARVEPSPSDRPFKSRFAEALLTEAHREWEALLDAGLIGTPPPPPSPEILANLARTEAIFRGGALFRRQQQCAPYWTPA